MAYENIQFRYPHMLIDSGYFCMFDRVAGVYIKYLSDGLIAYTYPLTSIISNDPKYIYFDGVYIWALHDGTTIDSDLKIYKWILEDSLCKLVKTINFTANSENRYSSTTFTVEHYDSFFSADSEKENTFIYLDAESINLIVIGDILVFGPNENGEYEEVEVIDIFDIYIEIGTYTKFSYKQNDPINILKSIWLFNNYSGLTSTGAIYKLKPSDGTVITKYTDNEYKNITACTFGKIDTIKRLGSFYSILYVKNNNLKFLNMSALTNYCIATIDNIKIDNSTIIPIKSISIYKDSIYRLQSSAMYFGSNITWTYYNYQITPIREYIDSITVNAYPKILPCDGVSITEITATVMDQYSQHIQIKPVNFYDDNSTGYITSNLIFTSPQGVATSIYRSGISPASVVLTAIATQYD